MECCTDVLTPVVGSRPLRHTVLPVDHQGAEFARPGAVSPKPSRLMAAALRNSGQC